MEEEDFNPYCELWNGTFTPMFHSANVVFGAAFLVPQSFALSLLALRTLVTFALVLTVVWAAGTVCRAPDMFLWNCCFAVINFIHLLILIKKHFPTFVSKDMTDLYTKVFRPLQINKKDFRLLTKECHKKTLNVGQFFCLERWTNVEDKLHILMSGKMSVKCDGLYLHSIQSNEFVDSVEWKSRLAGQSSPTFQVSVEAACECQLLVFESAYLEKVFESDSRLRFIMDCLVGKDVSKKLYAVSDMTSSSYMNDDFLPNQTKSSGPGKSLRVLDFHRTVSMDAIHTGGKGHVRSNQWLREAALKDINDDEQVAIVNFEMDVPPSLDYLPHNVPVHTVDKETMAEAQFLAQQRKYWPSGFI